MNTPPLTVAAARRLAPFVADGTLSPAEVVGILITHAVEHGYGGDRSGIQARLTWALTDAAAALTAIRSRVADFIERDAWASMDKLTPSAAILAAAERTNVRHGGPLSPEQLRAIVTDVAARWLRQRRYRHG